MTARRPPAILTAGDFLVLRQAPQVDKQRLVANIEAAFRKAIGAAALSDDAIVEAALDRGEQTPFERAGLEVIRMCIAFREAPAGDADNWLDGIGLALGKFEPIFEKRERQREHGKASGIARAPLAKHPELVRRIRKMLKDGENPRQYVKRWAAEGGISKSTLYQLIRRVRAE